jgi:hypothetical protein
MEITNMLFNLMTAQWLRSCGYFRYTSGKFSKNYQVSFALFTILNIASLILSLKNCIFKSLS